MASNFFQNFKIELASLLSEEQLPSYVIYFILTFSKGPAALPFITQEDTFENYQKLGMCGIAQVMHNPALFVDLPNFKRKRRSIFNRGDMFAGLGAAPAQSAVNNPFAAFAPAPALAPVATGNQAPINLQQRIIGGSEASPHSWPWAAQIVSGKYH